MAEGIHEALRQSGGDSFDESGESDVAPNLRQSRLLEEAAQELQSLAAAVRAGHPADILGVNLEAAMQLLDEVTGSSDNEEVLDRIFASFCIGK